MSNIEVHLYESNNTTHLAVLEQAFDVRYADMLSGVGSGQFSIPLSLPYDTTEAASAAGSGDSLLINASDYLLISTDDELLTYTALERVDKTALIEGGQIARLRLANVDVGAFLIERLETPDLLQQRVLQCSGRTLLALYERATVWPDDPDDYGTMERSYTSRTFAEILIDLAGEATTRGVSLPSDDFSGSNDSDGVAWTDSNTVLYKGGTTLLDVILQQAELGIEVTIGPTGVLHYYIAGGAGQDRTSSVFFREGMNILKAGSVEEHRDIANAILGEGQSLLSVQTDATSIAAYGRRERMAQHGNVSDATMLATLTQATRDQWKDPRSTLRLTVEPDKPMPYTYGVLVAQLPFVDYGLGDQVTVVMPTAGVNATYRIIGIALVGDGENVTAELTLNTMIDDYLVQLDHAMRRMLLSPITAIRSGMTNA